MKSMKQAGRRLCVMMTAAALMCTSVLPVYAEGVAEQDVQAQTDTQRVEAVAEASEPKLGVTEMTWSEGILEIPIQNIDVSQWRDQGNKLYVNGEEYIHGGRGITLVPGESAKEGKAVLSIDNAMLLAWNKWKENPSFYSQKGDYRVAVELTGASGNINDTWRSPEFTLHIPQNSQIWECPYKKAEVDGSSDITFEFQNGTGLFNITSVEWLNFIVTSSETEEAVMPAAGSGPDFSMMAGDGGYTVDLANSTVTIHRERLNKEITQWMADTGKTPLSIAIHAMGNLTGGDSSYFTYWIEAEDFISSWNMDLTKFDPNVEPEEPIIDWTKGEYYEDGRTYYLLDMKLGNGVLGYAPNWSGPEDVREAVKDGKTYYFVLPNSEYPLHYTFTIDGKYKDMNNPSGMKDGYEIQVKLVSGEGKAEPAGHGAPDWVIQFTASKATTYEVSVVEKGAGKPEETKQIVDKTSGVSMNLPTDAPEGLSLKVTESNGAEEKETVSKLVQVDGDKIKTFDLSLLLNGKVWEYDGQFKSTVTLPVPEGWNLDLLGLYYIDEATNKATAVSFTVDKENGTITFETDHFSRYVLVQKVAEQAGDKTTPKTGDAANVTLYMMMLLVAGAAVVAFERKRRA